jgi:DNA mismatch repair protein MutS2
MRDHLFSLSKLEFEKVKKHLNRYILSDLGREHVGSLFPTADKERVQTNLSLVTEMKILLESDETLPLDHVIDIRKSLQHSAIENYLLAADELHNVSLVINTSLKILRYFNKRYEAYPLLHQLVNTFSIEKVLAYNIDLAIDEYGMVKDNATKEISKIRQEINEKKQFLKKTLEQILKSVVGKDWIQDEIITTRDSRMVIPIKVEHKNRVPGFIHSSSASGATVYIEPTETLEVNNAIRTLEFQERREIEKLLKGLSEQVRNSRQNLDCVVEVLGRLDFIQAKAKYSIELMGSEPKFIIEGTLKINQGYHPILLQHHKRAEVVPLDIIIGDECNTIIITGPNAGGKSVTLKTVGLLCAMAQAGCHIPASPESEIKIFTDVFVDMGDEQSIENDLSSFSSHLNNLKYIVENSNRRSLVLLDELGSGTDPLEGASIAAAVLENLSEKGCSTIATTHHGSLKAFAFEHPHIDNGAMEFDQETLRPTYRFQSGVPGSSYALEMAQRLQIPESVILRAKQLKGNQSTNLESLILDLENRSQALRKNLEDVMKEKESLNSSINYYQNKITSLENEIKSIKSHALREAKEIVESANSTIERLVKEIKEQSARKEIVLAVKEEIKKLKAELQKDEEIVAPESSEKHVIKQGSYVRLKEGTTEGEVVEIMKDGYAYVLVGTVRLKVPLDALIITSKQQQRSLPIFQEQLSAPAKSEVDLRGMYGDEAIEKVAKVIDEALLHGLHRIDIIHGKGTGALRKKVTAYLQTNPIIKSFRLGEWNEGGSGVTVVELE